MTKINLHIFEWQVCYNNTSIAVAAVSLEKKSTCNLGIYINACLQK